MATVTRVAGRRVLRSLTAALLCAATLTLLVAPASAQVRSRGNFFVYQSPNCLGLLLRANDPTVTVPFSIGGRNYPPNTDLTLFATDMQTGDVFGPFVVTTDADGRFCQRVNQARPTRWKVDLIEPGEGFTDSKVITVFPSVPDTTTTTMPDETTTTTITTTTLPTTTTTTAPTTTVPGQTTTMATTTTTTTTLPTTTTTAATTTTAPGQTTLPTTTVPGQTTTTAAPGQTTTTLAGQTTTTAATTTAPGQTTTTTLPGATTSVPEQDLGFEIEPVPVPPEEALPATGSTDTSELTAIALALLATGAAAYFVTVRRRRAE